MTTSNNASSPVYFVSLGCPKNLVDSQVMLGLLEKDRYSITQKPEDAEVIIVNTCSFIDASKEESVETILEMAELKDSAKCKVLVASGCLPQRYHKQLEQELPEVDLFIGTGQYHRITELLNLQAESTKLGAPLPKRSYVDQPAFIHSESDPRVHTGPLYSGYLKLSEGCNRRCAFCIIPKLRGNVRSRTIASLVEEAKNMASRGVKELNLVAQDLTEYGMEWKYKENLEMLLPELCKIEGIEWIRLHYVYPDQFSDELVEIIAREPKIVKYLDMPIQHTNNRVLASMNRRLTKEKLFDLVSKLRAKIPSLVFRTSLIVGFPGETEEEFQEMKQDMAALKLEHVGVFRYSREEGTKAYDMEGQIHPSVKRRRAKELQKTLNENRDSFYTNLIQSKQSVLLEGLSDESDLLLQGRLSTQAQGIDGNILINDTRLLGDDYQFSPGDLIEVEVTEAAQGHLVGRALQMLSKSQIQQNSKTQTEASIALAGLTNKTYERPDLDHKVRA